VKRIKVYVLQLRDRDRKTGATRERKHLTLQWTDPVTGRAKSQTAGTADRREAKHRASDLESDLNNGRYSEPSKMPWGEFRQLFENEKLAGSRDGTQSKVGYILDRFESQMSPRAIGDVTERTLSGYIKALRDSGLAAATIHGHLAYLKVAFRWAHDQKIIPTVPKFPAVKIPKGASKRKIRAAARIGVDELSKLSEACPNHGWRLLLALAWHCGLRRNEARNVRGIDVDLRLHRIAIPDNKAGDEAATVFTTPELERLLLDRWPGGHLPEDRLITRDEVTADPFEITKQFRRIARNAGVKGGATDGFATLHDLRRSFGSRWAAKVPAQVLQRLMRHADIKTTLDFYADVEQAALGAIWGTAAADNSDEPNVIPIRQVSNGSHNGRANCSPIPVANTAT
jgi:integrase